MTRLWFKTVCFFFGHQQRRNWGTKFCVRCGVMLKKG